MNYPDLYNELCAHPPTGWNVFRHRREGVYFWPKSIVLLEDSLNNSILPNHSMLFEFHVTDAGSARILARARFRGEEPEDDLRWKTWHDIAVNHCHADEVKEAENAEDTRSVAKWPLKAEINPDNTPIDEVANLIREFLQDPPVSLTCFIGHLEATRFDK